MPKYRKVPVVITAVQYTGDNVDEIMAFTSGGEATLEGGELIVGTLEGPLRAAPQDFIIRGVNGEFYPVKPDIFAKTYERVLVGA